MNTSARRSRAHFTRRIAVAVGGLIGLVVATLILSPAHAAKAEEREIRVGFRCAGKLFHVIPAPGETGPNPGTAEIRNAETLVLREDGKPDLPIGGPADLQGRVTIVRNDDALEYLRLFSTGSLLRTRTARSRLVELTGTVAGIRFSTRGADDAPRYQDTQAVILGKGLGVDPTWLRPPAVRRFRNGFQVNRDVAIQGPGPGATRIVRTEEYLGADGAVNFAVKSERLVPQEFFDRLVDGK